MEVSDMNEYIALREKVGTREERKEGEGEQEWTRRGGRPGLLE